MEFIVFDHVQKVSKCVQKQKTQKQYSNSAEVKNYKIYNFCTGTKNLVTGTQKLIRDTFDLPFCEKDKVDFDSSKVLSVNSSILSRFFHIS